MERLSYIDEHAISVDASVAETWSALLRVLCRDPADPATVQVGKLDEAIRHQRLALNGRHLCFAVYRLVFELDPKSDSDGVRLRALTWAAFPGVRGKLFRAVAIGSGAHRFVVRRMLKHIAAQARARKASVG
jgi:hypothetical protein